MPGDVVLALAIQEPLTLSSLVLEPVGQVPPVLAVDTRFHPPVRFPYEESAMLHRLKVGFSVPAPSVRCRAAFSK